MKRILSALALGGAVAIASALPASASVHHAAFTSTTITIVFSDHGDGGAAEFCGGTPAPSPRLCWANDEGQAFVTVTQTGAGTYTAHLSSLEGSFATIPGQLAPNQSADPGLAVTSNSKPGATATIAGSADYSFTADEAPLPSGTTVVISGDNPRLSDWEALAFPAGTDVTGTITDYSLIYREKCSAMSGTQTWTETNANNDGMLPADGNIKGC